VGTYLGPLVASYIADSDLGWRWIGYLGAILSGATFVIFYFGLEETEFNRDRYLAATIMDGPLVREKSLEHAVKDKKSGEITTTTNAAGKGDDEESHKPSIPNDVEGSRSGLSAYSKHKTYWDRIRPITPSPNLRGWGFKQYGQRLWHTMRVFSFPAVWFAGLQWGLQNVCLTFYLSVEEDNWFDPPWNYDDVQDGNMNIPCLIGSVLGCVYGGYCSDQFLIWMTKRNKGVMESEFRLYLMFLCVLIFPTGMWLFGVGSANGWSWPVPYVGLAFIGFGYGCAGDLSLTYLADSYPDMVLEGMVGVAVINNTLALIFTFAASFWLNTSLRNCFVELGVISFLVLMLSLPMILYGKSARRWTKGRYLAFLQLRDGFST